MTPITRAPYRNGTAIWDSSITCVPSGRVKFGLPAISFIPSIATVARREHLLDVTDLDGMRRRLAAVSLENFLRVASEAVKQSELSLSDVSFVIPIHMKRSMQHMLLDRLGLDEGRSIYLEDTGHMSGVDNLLGLERLQRTGRLRDGDAVLLLAAGIGYTWAATVLRWGAAS